MNNEKLQAQLDNLEQSRSDIVEAIKAKGIDISSSAKLSECPAAILDINVGGLPLDMCRATQFNPTTTSATLEQSGYSDVVLDYLASIKCYVFNAAGTKKAEIASAQVTGDYTTLSGTVVFADGTEKTINELNSAGCNFMVYHPEMNLYVETLDDGSQMLYFGGKHKLTKTSAITIPEKYIGMFEAYYQTNSFKSQPARNTTTKLSMEDSFSNASSNGEGFGLMSYFDWQKIVALFITCYGSTDTNVIGSFSSISGGTYHISGHGLPLLGNSDLVTIPKSDGTNVNILHLFGLEEFIGGKSERIQNVEKRGATVYIWDGNTANRPSSGYRTLTIPSNLSSSFIKTIYGNSKFDVIAKSYGGTQGTGWCSKLRVIYGSSSGSLMVGGRFDNTSDGGIAYQFFDDVTGSQNANFSCRIAYSGEIQTVNGADLLN